METYLTSCATQRWMARIESPRVFEPARICSIFDATLGVIA